MERLTLRALNRATLARQLLLARTSVPVIQAIERLAGLNAQHSPSYLSLWSRLQDFHRDELTQQIEQCAVARATVMRSTLHLVTARDYLLFSVIDEC